MGWSSEYLVIFTIPTGATTGQRIVIDGTTGTIKVYNSANQLVDVIGGPQGAIIMGAAPGPQFQFNEPSAGILTTYDASGNISAQWNPGANSFTMLDNTNLKFVQLTGSQVAWGLIAAAGDLPTVTELSNAAYILIEDTVSPFTAVNMQLVSPIGPNTATADYILMKMESGQGGSATGSANNPTITIQDLLSTSAVDILLSGNLANTDDGGITTGWQTPTLGSGWANSAIRSSRPLTYRFDCEDNVHFAGSLNTTSATPANPIFTTPSPYVPKHNQAFTVLHENSGGTLINICSGFWTTTGLFEIFSAGTISSGDIFTFNETLPMDRLP